MALKVSVIIPVYNGEQFIARAIESILSQTYPAHEIIVINDGSKDRTEEVLRTFEGRICFKTIPNGGVSNARNQGIHMATGDIIAFLDADDIWTVDKLEVQESFFTRHPRVGFCCCNYHVFNPYLNKEVDHFTVLQGRPVIFNAPLSGKDSLKLLLALNFVGTASTVVLKKDVLRQVGAFNTSYKQAEDYELWLRAAMATDFVIASKVLVEKKNHGTNLTNDQFEMNSFHKAVLIDFLKTHEVFIHEHELKGQFMQAISDVDFKLGNISYNLGRKMKSLGFYVKSFSQFPTSGNFLRMLGGMLRKSVRSLSFGLISRDRFKKQGA